MTSRSRAVPHVVLNPLALALGLAFIGCAQAQQSPWYIGVSQAFTRDSNVFQAPKGRETSDTVSSTGVLGGLKLELGRQLLFADVSASSNRYQDLEMLDNTSYSINTGLRWQTVERLSGNVSLRGRQDLGQLAIPGTPQVRNVVKLRSANASARYGFASQLGLEGGVDRRMLKYSYTTERDLEEQSANLGLRWGTPGGVLTLGVSGRVTEGEAPNFRTLLDPQLPQLGFGPLTPDDYDRQDVEFTATWTPSALSTVTGRISLTRQDHSVDARPDISGVTGSATWDYRPTGKLAVNASLTRDTSSQILFTSSLRTLFEPVEVNTDRLSTMLSVGADYELTAKIALNGRLAYTDGDIQDASGRKVGRSSSKLMLGARYQATRGISLACDYSRQSYANFVDSVAGCSAQFVLR
jgi:hypothetical protein